MFYLRNVLISEKALLGDVVLYLTDESLFLSMFLVFLPPGLPRFAFLHEYVLYRWSKCLVPGSACLYVRKNYHTLSWLFNGVDTFGAYKNFIASQ